jgi:hypothetical protein
MVRTPPSRVPRRGGGARALLAGLVLLGAVGSCQLPKPKIPSVGSAPGPQPAAAAIVRAW